MGFGLYDPFAHAAGKGLSNAFSTHGLNINSSINLFMRHDDARESRDKGGYLSVSLSMAHSRRGCIKLHLCGRNMATPAARKNQLSYNVAHNWYADARGENEYGLSASGINSDSLNTSAYTRRAGDLATPA